MNGDYNQHACIYKFKLLLFCKTARPNYVVHYTWKSKEGARIQKKTANCPIRPPKMVTMIMNISELVNAFARKTYITLVWKLRAAEGKEKENKNLR